MDSVPGLVALAQAGILEVHPWNSRVSRLEQPDQVIFDLDPDEALPFSRVAAAARRVRALLARARPRELREDDGGQGPARVRARSSRSAGGRSSRSSRGRWRCGSPATSRTAFTANMAKAQRKGKVFVDYLRNVRGANAVGAFSTRAREGAPVSVPVDWDELDRLSGATDFTVAEVPLRVLGFGSGRAADPWARYLELEAAGSGLAHARPGGLTRLAGRAATSQAGRAAVLSARSRHSRSRTVRGEAAASSKTRRLERACLTSRRTSQRQTKSRRPSVRA